MILLYFSSATYHILSLDEEGTKKLKRLDHMMIYILIAGTYTPICLVPMRGHWGWTIFIVVWTIAISGILFKIYYINAPRWLSTILYLMMGWICVLAIYPMTQTIPTGGIVWLAIGGIMYSIGAVIYALKKPNPIPNVFGFHEIWHLFVLAGTFSHFITIYVYISKVN
jgi:hemolysin III